MRILAFLLLLTEPAWCQTFEPAEAVQPQAAASASPTPELLRFFAAADTARERASYDNPILLRVKALRLKALQAPASAPQEEEQLYSLLIPGLDQLPPVAREAILRLERRRAGLLSRVQAAEAELAIHDARRSKLAAVKRGLLGASFEEDLDGWENELNALLNAEEAGARERFLALARIEQRAARGEQARFHALYDTALQARNPEQLQGLFDGSSGASGSVPAEQMPALGSRASADRRQAADPAASNLGFDEVPPSPDREAAQDDSLSRHPLMRKVSGLVDRFGEAMGVYSLIRAAGGKDPRAFVLALIHNESGFRPGAVSPKGAVGLMQVMPGTARLYGVRSHLADLRNNIRAGLSCLRDALREFGRLDLALAAYNAGSGRVRRYGGIPPIRETRRYVRVILREYQRRANEPVDVASAQ